MDIARLYDEQIADHYDVDRFGLLRGGRAIAQTQIAQHLQAPSPVVVDLALGTGASAAAVQAGFPAARLTGIDISQRMLDVAAARVPGVQTILDDAANVTRHVAPASVDLVLMHYLTTYVDGARVVADAATTLRPGGLLSIASSTWEAFPTLNGLISALLPAGLLQELNGAPTSVDVVAGFLEGAGLEIVARDTFTTAVSFASFDEVWDFGVHSGFFTHIIDGLPPETVAMLRSVEGIYPIEDTYTAGILLARRRP
ncbi:MAG TPA: class I SAM-dependent methyltransferase [Myxococcota bacterium]